MAETDPGLYDVVQNNSAVRYGSLYPDMPLLIPLSTDPLRIRQEVRGGV